MSPEQEVFYAVGSFIVKIGNTTAGIWERYTSWLCH